MTAKSSQILFSAICVLTLSCQATAQSRSQPATSPQVVEGVAVDEGGHPIAGALVTLSSSSFTTTSHTDNEGSFRLELMVQESLVLEITAQGFATIKQRIVPQPGGSSLRFVLKPANLTAHVSVTATRTNTPLDETAASIAVLGQKELESTAAITLDDSLRRVPGFSLFRRSGSRIANPTTQGVSLRGLGASGASRAVVLADGIPLNDPFGGWVYWDRVPRTSVEQIEVLRGSASQLYGSAALGGVINIITKTPRANSLLFEASYGNQSTPSGSLFLSGKKGEWGASLSAEIFNTDGYVLVSPSERGPVDSLSGSSHSVVWMNGDRMFDGGSHIFAGISFFQESRRNGTLLQTNQTHLRQFSFGGELVTKRLGAFSASSYGGTQVYNQDFSAVSADRSRETLTRAQRVPAQILAFSSQWSCFQCHKQTLVAGLESQTVRGSSDEIVFINGKASSLVGAGGREQTTGGYFEDIVPLGSHLFLTFGARVDYWRNYRALSATTPITTNMAGMVVRFPNRAETAFSPHLSGVYQANSHVSLLFSVGRAFRAPTLNELYRSFRVGNALTVANENLKAERLTGGEMGLRMSVLHDQLAIRGTSFWNVVTRPVANVTLQTTPALITRQRQNLGRTVSRGFEAEADARLNSFWKLTAGYLFTDATVVRFPANTALEGLSIPQVPRQQFTVQALYTNPAIVTVGIQARASSSQFDDDQNLFRLGSYFVLDAMASRALSSRLELFAGAENVFSERYEIGKTPITTLGPPILVRLGFRLRLGNK